MSEPAVFYPVKKKGLTLHIFLGLLLAGGGGVLLWLAFNPSTAGFIILYLIGALVLLAVLPFIVYRAYALIQASYAIERDGLSIRWGLRKVDIPFTELEWIHPIGELTDPLRLPPLSMPGAYLGTSTHPDLGTVEFIASDANSMVVIASFDHVYVLSPEQPENFINAFSRTLEMGSISPIEAYSSQPAEFLRTVLANRFARAALIISLALTIFLVIATSLLIPLRSSVSMGIDAVGIPLAAVPSNRLLILPLIGAFALVLNIVVGLFFYRHEDQRPVSYTVWSAAVITPILLIVALLLMMF
jgi:hypothetical protein